MGEYGKDRSIGTVQDHWMSAMQSYIDAADCIPDDDKNHPCKATVLLTSFHALMLFKGI